MRYYMTSYDALSRGPDEDLGIAIWREGQELYRLQLVDRTGVVRFPFALEVHRSMPSANASPALAYEQCCEKRAAELVELSRAKGVPVAVMYSGGIDSTVALVSLLKQLGSQAAERVIVRMDRHSIAENRDFYAQHIRGKLRVLPCEPMGDVLRNAEILVTGELNDQLFGFDIMRLQDAGYPIFEALHQPYCADSVIGWLTAMRFSRTAAGQWFELMDASARAAPCTVRTNFELLWWINFAWKWQFVWFRMLMRQRNADLDALVLGGHYQHFFDSSDFQTWSLSSREPKIDRSWESYKMPAKQVIYGFDRNEDYLRYKTKVMSGHRMSANAAVVAPALTAHFTFDPAFTRAAIYDERHSFQ